MAFNIPNFSQTPQKPVIKPTPWVRPVDWITITDTPGEIHFLVSSLGLGAYALRTVFTDGSTTSINIDWGDGVVDTITNYLETTTYHNYTTGGTACSLGYDTWKVRVYSTDPSGEITECRFVSPIVDGITLYPTAASGLLEAYFGDDLSISSFNSYFLSTDIIAATVSVQGQCGFYNLQYVKLPSIINLPDVNLSAAFQGCNNLQEIVMPVSAPNVTTIGSMFFHCNNLKGNIIIPQDAINILDMGGIFMNCFSITGITLPPELPLVTTMINFARNCYNLIGVQVPALPSCYTYNDMFDSCYSMLSVRLNGFPPIAAPLSLVYMFYRCYSLQQILLPEIPVEYQDHQATVTNMFNSCFSLTSIVLPSNLYVDTYAGLFQNNYSLISAVLPIKTSTTTMASCFSACYNLQSVTLPTITEFGITMASTFINCVSLGSITIPSGYSITSLSSTFNNCANIKNIVLPNTNQSELTTMASMCVGCYSLESIVMPTGLPAVTTLSSTFNGTTSLESVTFPSTMNSVTTMLSLFNSSGIQSVTLPTSMTSLTAFSSSFSKAFNIETITMPSTIAASVSSGAANAFQNCPKLKTLTLPTTQTTTLVSLDSIFLNSSSLQTINNLDKLGSPSTSSTSYVLGTNLLTLASSFTGTTDFYCKFSKLELQGSATYRSALTALRLRNTGTGQYGGTSPQINISYTNLSQAALVQVFNDLPTLTSKTIDITDATGAAALTGPERAIATGKGWTITG
jgi:hypothetical protein